MNSVIYNLNGNDKTLILGARGTLLQSFKAMNWTDLRFTLAYSLTKESDPNDPTGLAEAIGTGQDNNQVYIGFKKSDSLLPPSTDSFVLSTQLATPDSASTTLADGGDFLNFFHTSDDTKMILASNGTTKQNNGPSLSSPRVQDKISGPTYSGYATILMLRMTRNDPTLNKVDTLEAHTDGGAILDNGVPFATDTTVANLRALTAAAAFQAIIGPFAFNTVPDALFFYWPFNNSRLRIHDYVLEKYA